MAETCGGIGSAHIREEENTGQCSDPYLSQYKMNTQHSVRLRLIKAVVIHRYAIKYVFT